MRTATVPLKNGLKAEMEVFSSMADALTTLKGRKPIHADINKDFIHGAPVYDPQWSGFRSGAELQERIRSGISDPAFISKVQRCKGELSREIAKLREVKRDVTGGNVVVPLYVQGIPECMTRVVTRKVKSKVIRMVLDPAVYCRISGEDLKSTATAVAIAIASLERSGFRVEVNIMTTVVTGSRTGPRVLSCMMPMKRAEEALNIPKLLFMVANPSYFRGLVFNWLTTNPRFPRNPGLGYSLSTELGSKGAREAVLAMAKATIGDGCVPLIVQPLCEDFRDTRDRYATEDEAIAKLATTILQKVESEGL